MTQSILMFASVYIAAGIALLIGLALGTGIGKVIERRHFYHKLKEARSDAVKRSRAVLSGQCSEQFAPFLPKFPANPTEIRFIGKPVDFIAFSGSSQGKIDEILFIEVKSGKASLSTVERSLKTAIQQKRIRYVEYRTPS